MKLLYSALIVKTLLKLSFVNIYINSPKTKAISWTRTGESKQLCEKAICDENRECFFHSGPLFTEITENSDPITVCKGNKMKNSLYIPSSISLSLAKQHPTQTTLNFRI